MNLRFVGDEHLTKLSEEVNDVSQEFLNQMKKIMIDSGGVGIAAPQVGYNIRVLLVQVTSGWVQEFINPEIIWSSYEKVEMYEGCLSIPGKEVLVNRPESVRVKFKDKYHMEKVWLMKGFEARVFQHEFDHLNGVLMTDYLL